MAIKTCPYCNTAHPAPPVEVDLGANTVTLDGTVVFLRPAVAELMYAVRESYPATVTFAQLSSALWGAADGPMSEDGVIRIEIGHLRTALLHSRWGIITARTRGFYLGLKGCDGSACYCGGPLEPHALEAYVDKTTILLDGKIVKATPTVVRMCSALLALPVGGYLSAQQLGRQLYGEDLRRDVKQVEVQMYHLRAVLKGTPWTVQVRWRQGYYIERSSL